MATVYDLSTGRHLRKTARLLLVCSPAALESQAVPDEIKTFLLTKRRIVPIHLTAESTTEGFKPFPELLSPDLLWIKEYPEALGTGPSKEVLEEIQQTFRLQRQQQKRVHWLAGAAAAFAVIAVPSFSRKFVMPVARNE